MKLAAIDIGSNAIRLQIVKISELKGNVQLKKLDYTRFPLRLGKDVFRFGKIQPQTEAKFVKLMSIFQSFFDLHEVDDYLVCATSAMRESENGEEIVKRVYHHCGLKINIIDGDKEAELISKAIYRFLENKNYIHIDVGGGSTELNIYQNKEKIATKSFKIGTIRNLSEKDLNNAFENASEWLERKLTKIKGKIIAVGTGGNINKTIDLSGEKCKMEMSLEKLKSTRDYIKKFSYEDRVKTLKLNPDRADVIIPASDIYIKMMEFAQADKILVPNVGLKDGVISHLYSSITAPSASSTKS